MRAANDSQSNGASLFGFGHGLRCAWSSFAASASASKLFGVGENEIHVLETYVSRSFHHDGADTNLVECKHLSNQLSTILKSYLHAVVDLKQVSIARSQGDRGSLRGFAVQLVVSQILCATSRGAMGEQFGRLRSGMTYHLSLSVGGCRHG